MCGLGLVGDDTSSCREIGADCKGARSAMVCGYTDVLKDISADEEGGIAREGIEA